jgi:hypothetical protein
MTEAGASSGLRRPDASSLLFENLSHSGVSLQTATRWEDLDTHALRQPIRSGLCVGVVYGGFLLMLKIVGRLQRGRL